MSGILNSTPTFVEIAASSTAVVAASFMGSNETKKRIFSNTLFLMGNVLTMKVAIDNNMTPLLGQMVLFSYLAYLAINKNAEILEQEENKENLISKFLKQKNRAIKNGLNRFEKIYNKSKELILDIKKTIKNNIEGSFLFSSSLLFLFNEPLNTISQHLIQSPTQTIAAALALYGSYLLTKPTLDNRFKGISAFLAADVLYIGIAQQKELYPLLIQSIVFLGTSAKALMDVDKGFKEINSSYFKEMEKQLSKILEVVNPKQKLKTTNFNKSLKIP